MLSIKIEKEIKGKNKVAFGLDLRQLVCVAAGFFGCVAVWKLTGMSVSNLVIPFAAIGTVAGAFGWLNKDGMMLEDFLKRYMEQIVYKNSKLTYKTRNLYVQMYNSEKINEQNRLANDKKYRREMKKKNKTAAKKHSKLVSYT